jgi:S-adenosylmethionine synthetase
MIPLYLVVKQTTLKLNKKLLKDIVNESFEACGYLPDKRERFKKEEVYLAKDVKIINKIHAQSPDIACATTNRKNATGWNDQGIFFSGYDSRTPTGQGVGKFLAQNFGDYLFDYSKQYTDLGSDIKIVFTLDVDDKDMITAKDIVHVTVAIPSLEDSVANNNLVKSLYEDWQKDFNYTETYPELHKLVTSSKPEFTVNGTGRYVNHGFHSDASMTGRKLAVNNMSVGPVYSMCQCGGGSYIKPWHASDFLLPMVATWISKAVVDLGLTSYANVALACTIGSRSIDSFCITGDAKFNKDVKLRKLLTTALINYGISPDSLKDRWGLLDVFDFYKSELQNFVKTTGLYSNVPWYDTKDLVNYLRPIIDDGMVEQ